MKKELDVHEDVRESAEKVFRELEKTQKIKGKTGLDITNLRKNTGLSRSATTKALSALSTAKIISMENVGTSKFYHLKELKR